MGDFFAPPPGYPDVPPAPSTPPPSFETIGKTFGIGLSESNVGTGILGSLFDILVRWFTYVLGLVLQLALKVFAFIIRTIVGIEDEASLGYGQVVSATLLDLFGVNVDPSAVSTRGANANKQAAANAMAQAILGTLFNKPVAQAGGGITPSDQNPNRYLQTVMNMELNGWLESWFTDAVSYHLLEKYGDLKDGIARVLGLGRMSRQVLAPPLKVFVHDPYLALLENTYRTKPVDAGTAVQAFLRAEYDRDMLSTLLGPQGYQEREIDWLIRERSKYLSPADLNYLIQRQQWTTQQAVTNLGYQGYDPSTAQTLLAIEADKELQAYRKQAIGVAESSYVDGNMDQASFQNLVSGSGLTDVEQSWIQAIANLKRQAHVTHLSRGDIEQGILDGVLSFNDLKTWATRVNMPLDEEAYLELMILFKQNKETATAVAKANAAKAKAQAAADKTAAAAAKAAAAKAQAADKGVTVQQAELLVKDGLWTFDQLTAFLTTRGYGPDAIASIVHLLQTEITDAQAKAAAAAHTRAAAAAKGLSLADEEKAVIAGVLTVQDLGNYLTAHGFDAADSQTILDLVQQQIAAAQTKAAAKATATQKAAAKSISLPELEHAVRLGLAPQSQYDAALKAAGFDAMSITLLNGILSDQIAADKATAAKRDALIPAGATAGVSIPQLEQEVIEGVRPIADYTADLAKLGYNAADQQDLTQLLETRVKMAAAVANYKTQAGLNLESHQLTFTQYAYAVKLGILPLSGYVGKLTAAGYNPGRAQILGQILQAEMAKTKQAQTKATAAAAAAAKKKISLPEIERAVIAGIQPITDYTATLAQLGYSAADMHTLTQLLQLKVDAAAAAAQRHVDAEGLATQRGISLGALESSIIDGAADMGQYDAVLTDLGYDLTDRTLLEQLLQKRVDAAAAKAAKAAPPSSPPPAA